MSTTEFDQDFLNIDLDSLPEAPPIEVPPSGIYDLSVSVTPKVVTSKKDGKTYKLIEFRYTVNAVIEMLDKNSGEPITGQMFSTSTSLEPERIKWHSANIKALAEIAGVKTVQDLFKTPSVRCIAKVIRRENKDNPGEYYANVSEIQAA